MWNSFVATMPTLDEIEAEFSECQDQLSCANENVRNVSRTLHEAQVVLEELQSELNSVTYVSLIAKANLDLIGALLNKVKLERKSEPTTPSKRKFKPSSTTPSSTTPSSTQGIIQTIITHLTNFSSFVASGDDQFDAQNRVTPLIKRVLSVNLHQQDNNEFIQVDELLVEFGEVADPEVVEIATTEADSDSKKQRLVGTSYIHVAIINE